MRLPGRRGPAAAQRPSQLPPAIICPVCGLRNDITARFCRNCGLPLGAPRDPVRGTTTRRADLPSDRGTGIAAVLGLVAIVALTGLAAFLVLRGLEGVEGTAGGPGTSAPSGHVASAPPTVPSAAGPSPSGPDATRVPGSSAPTTPDPDRTPGATSDPEPTRTPRATDRPDPTDDPRPTATPLGLATRFTCGDAAIEDPHDRRWRITQASWTRGSATDVLTLQLASSSGTARRGAVVRMDMVSPGRAASTYGVTRPDGDRALVLTFEGPVTLSTTLIGSPGLRALRTVDIRRDDDGVVHAVMGIEGDGCVRMRADDWKSSRATSAKLVLEFRR